jgi:hypothetical protein
MCFITSAKALAAETYLIWISLRFFLVENNLWLAGINEVFKNNFIKLNYIVELYNEKSYTNIKLNYIVELYKGGDTS